MASCLSPGLPVLAVSPTRSDEERWSALRRTLGARGLLFTTTSSGGVARGTVAIDDSVATILEILAGIRIYAAKNHKQPVFACI